MPRSLKCFNKLSLVFLLCFVFCLTNEVQLLSDIPTNTISKSSEFNVCIKPERPSSELANCFGHQVLQKLQDLEEKEEFSLADGVSLRRDEAGPRDISNYLDKDPLDIRSIVEGASTLMSRRAMQWDMAFLQPGLQMRVGPTLSSNSVLEFVIDPRIRDRESHEHEPSTARLLTRQLLVPFLLGFKFQLSTLLPLLFGLMVLLSKKALVLAKIAVVAASVFGFQSLSPGHGYGYQGGPGLSVYGNRYQPDYFYKSTDQQQQQHPHQQNTEEEVDPYYAQNTYKNSHVTGPDRVTTPEDLRDRLERLFVTKRNQDRIGIRNFAWNE